MINYKLVVFISSTSDLQAEREMLASSLPTSFYPYLYERERSRAQKPRDRIIEVLRKSSAFVSVLGERYGSVYPDCKADSSIVEWEVKTAREFGKQQKIEVMAFRKANIDMSQIDERQRRFLEKIGGFNNEDAMWIKSYDTPEHLCSTVKDSLLEWLSEFYLELQQRGVKGATDNMMKLIIATGVLFLAIGALVFYFGGGV